MRSTRRCSTPRRRAATRFPAINVTSSETLNAALRGFAEAGSDGIVQVTTGGAEFLSGRRRRHGARCAGARRVRARARRALPVADRAAHRSLPARQVDAFLRPLLAESAPRVAPRRAAAVSLAHVRRLDAAARGEPARSRASCSSSARALGVVLEVECGVVGGEEDGIAGDGRRRRAGSTRRPTTCCASPRCSAPASAAATCSRRRSATSTASTRPATCSCAPRSCATGQEALARAPPRRALPVRLPRQQRLDARPSSREAIAYGVVKVNLDTDAQYAFTARDRRPRVRPLRRRADGRRRPGRQARLRPAGVGPQRPRPRWPRASPQAVRAVRLRRPQHHRLITSTGIASGGRPDHGRSAMRSRNARARVRQASRVKAHSSRARGGSSRRRPSALLGRGRC